MHKDILIHEFQKNALEKVKIQFKEINGRETIDIRAYYKVPETADEWKPSKKGICMSVKHLDELVKGIQLANEKWKKNIKIKKV